MPATMTVDETYRLMLYALNKSQQGYLSPQQFGMVINQAQFSYFNYLLGEFQKYQPGRPIAPVEWGQTAQIRERLTPFIQPPSTLTVDAGTGNTPYPDNYEYWDAMYYGIYKKPVKFIQQDRLASHLNSYIRPIAQNPVFLSIYTGFTVYPNSIGTTQLSYIRTPRTINWNYTQDIYGRPVYTSVNSTDPEWRREDMLQIIVRALAIVGVNLQSAAIAQYAENIKNLGQ